MSPIMINGINDTFSFFPLHIIRIDGNCLIHVSFHFYLDKFYKTRHSLKHTKKKSEKLGNGFLFSFLLRLHNLEKTREKKGRSERIHLIIIHPFH